MRSLFQYTRLRTLAAAFCVCLAFGLIANPAFAQWGYSSFGASSFAEDAAEDAVAEESVSADAAEEPAAVSEYAVESDAADSEPADAADINDEAPAAASEDAYVSEPAESIAAETYESPAIAPQAEEPRDVFLPSFLRPAAVAAPEPVFEVIHEEPAPVYVEEEPVVEAPAVAAAVRAPRKCSMAKEEFPLEKSFRYGVRAGVGVSAFAGHKAIFTPSFGSHAISLGPLFSASTGLVFAAPVTDGLCISWEILYSLYTAHGEFTLETKGADFGKLNQAGVELHSLEMPILANLNIGGNYYVEIGPQFGVNLYSRIYANNDLKKPYLNNIAFCSAVGFGVKLNPALAVGIRGTFNFIEYAENSNGRPWSVQAGVTSYFKN